MKSKIYKRIIYSFMSLIIVLSSVNVSIYANPAGIAVGNILKSIGYSVLGTSVATVTAHLVEGWLGNDRSYYDAQGSNPVYDYSSNNQNFGSMTNSGANNEHCYNTYNSSTTNNRVKSIVKNSYNTTTNTYDTRIYCPITNTYQTTNNISYNYDYDTYFIENNEYNYYVTNNYTYVSYYIINNETKEEDYYEVYYELPDGRNSYDLEPNQIWGEYFIYDVVNYDSYYEDDGKTLALYHLDGDGKDSSYWQNNSSTLGSGVFCDSKFGNGLLLSNNVNFFCSQLISPLSQSYTIEFVVSHNDDWNLSYEYITFLAEFSDGDYRSCRLYGVDQMSKPGVYYCCIVFDGKNFTFYVNGAMGRLISSYSSSSANEYLLNKKSEFIKIDSGKIIFSPFMIGSDTYSDYIIDEVRVSDGAMYDWSVDKSIEVPVQSFDSNEVLILPDNVHESLIAVQGRYKVNNYRIGGVRPTYPVLGDVYIYLEDNKVMDIQQYQGDGWYSINGAIYKDGEWCDLTKFDLSTYHADEDEDTGGIDDGVTDKEPSTEEPSTEEPSTEEPSTEEPSTEEPSTEEPSTEEPSTGDLPSGGDDIDITVSGNGTGSSGSSGGGLSGLLDGVSGFFDGIFAIVGKLLEYLGKGLDLLTGVVEKVLNLVPKNITNLLVGIFPFIPKEWVTAIELSLVLGVVIGIVGIFKK